jgi:hypothetical protein
MTWAKGDGMCGEACWGPTGSGTGVLHPCSRHVGERRREGVGGDRVTNWWAPPVLIQMNSKSKIHSNLVCSKIDLPHLKQIE